LPAIAAGLIGLSLGSFTGLVADRLPAGRSIIRGRSRCPACGRVLTPVDLVPVLGFAVRRGRCASCGAPIGWRYPALEAVDGLLMAFAVAWLGPLRGLAVGLIAVALLGSAIVVRSTWRSPS
jgi:leader peptidase (prepilin peptidase)/N-methyltransferase